MKTNQSFNLSIFLILSLFYPLQINAQQTSSEHMEIAVQVYNISPDETITFELEPVSNEVYAIVLGETCVFAETDPYSSSVTLSSNYLGVDKGFKVAHLSENQNEPTMRKALNRIKITSSKNTYDPEVVFYFDSRDCLYYSTCSGGYTQDIVLSFNANNASLWFHKNHIDGLIPPAGGGWEPLADSTTKTVWEVRGVPHCPLDFLGEPDTPTNLTITGNIGENPTLSWNANIEPDLVGYNIYQKFGTSNYGYLTTILEPSTTFTDNGVIIENMRFADEVHYKITAIDEQDLESDYSNEVLTWSNTLEKSESKEKNDELNKYYLSDAYPNPFNPSTRIYYSLLKDDFVTVKIFNLLGEEIRTLVNEKKNMGRYSISFDASNLPSGIYIYTINTSEFQKSKKMVLAK